MTSVLSIITDSSTFASRFGSGSYIVTLNDGFSLAEVMNDHSISTEHALLFTAGTPGFSAFLSGSDASSLSTDSRVKAVEQDQVAHTGAIQTTFPITLTSPNVIIPWGLDRLDQRSKTLNGLYTSTNDGTGVKVYVVDSGVNASHPDLTSRITPSLGWSYRAVSSAKSSEWFTVAGSCKTNTASYTYNQYDHEFDVDTFDSTYTPGDYGNTDNNSHGTHVAGIISGTNTGVAKGVTIVPVRVLNSCGTGREAMIKAGLEWILANHQIGEPAIVNLSVGFATLATSIDTAIADLLAEGVTVIAAAGNSGITACNSTPAATPGTISVGASDSNDVETSFSNYGECIDILAPGASVWSAWPYYKRNSGSTPIINSYLSVSGTSMSAPHVSGAAAIRLQSVPTSTPIQVWEWMKSHVEVNAITYVSRPGQIMSPNRLLNLAGPTKVASLTATPGSKSLVVSWAQNIGDGNDVTYTATASPDGATCTSTTTTCTIIGLVSSRQYTVSVVGKNILGSSESATTTGIPVGPPLPPISLKAEVASRSLDVSWAHAVGDGAGISYTVTAMPDGATCSVVGTSCTLTNLVNGRSYSLSVTGTDPLGTGDAATITAVPDGPPEVPAVAQSLVASRSITVSWPVVTTSDAVTYIVIATPGGQKCETTESSCTVTNLSNGIDYLFEITTRSGTGQVATASAVQVVARPGFIVKKVAMRRATRTKLGSVVSSVSPGRRTWSETGLCRIASSYLVAPRKSTRCVLTLKVAKSGKFPAMSTRVSIRIS